MRRMGMTSVIRLFHGRDSVLDVELDRALAMRYAGSGRGNIRIPTGRFLTREEWARKRAELVAKRLP